MKIKTKNKLIGLGVLTGVAAAVVTPLAVGISNNSGQSILFQGRRTIIRYSAASGYDKQEQNLWDLSVQALNMKTRAEYDSISTGLFRQRTTQSSKVEETKDGTRKLVRPKEEKMTFDAIKSVSIDSDPSIFTDYDTFAAVLDDKKAKEFTFTVNDKIKYVNSFGKETKYDFQASDFFYGFLRSIYTSESVRAYGNISGSNPVSPLEDEYLDELHKNELWYTNDTANSKYDNANSYLLNLFGLDIQATIDANLNSTKTDIKNNDEFKIVFQTEQSTAIISNFIANTISFTAVPGQKIREMNGDVHDFINKPGESIQLEEFGRLDENEGKVNLEDELLVSRYIFTNYDINPGTNGIVVEKNIHSYDETFNNDQKNIEKYQMLIYDRVDEDAFAQARQKSFMKDNSESILLPSVAKNATLINEIKGNLLYEKVKPSSTGRIAQLFFNPYFFVTTPEKQNRFSDEASNLLFGANTNDVINSTTADDEYWLGRGRTFRSLLNASVNMIGLTKEYMGGDNSSVKTVRNYNADQPIIPGYTIGDDIEAGNTRTGISHGMETAEVQNTHYQENKNNTGADKPYLDPSEDKLAAVKAAWAKLKTDSGVTGDVVIPLYDFRAKDQVETPEITSTFKTLIEHLNKVTIGTGIEFKQFDTDANKNINHINKITGPMYYIGAHFEDYASSASFVQQILSAPYVTQTLYSLLTKGFSSGKISSYTNDQNKWDDSEEFDISGLVEYINDNQSEYSNITQTILDGITLEDWQTVRGGLVTLTGREKYRNAISEIDSAAQHYFFSISNNKDLVRSWTNFTEDMALTDKLAITYTSYTSLGSEQSDDVNTATIYAQPWLDYAQRTSLSPTDFNLVDTKIK